MLVSSVPHCVIMTCGVHVGNYFFLTSICSAIPLVQARVKSLRSEEEKLSLQEELQGQITALQRLIHIEQIYLSRIENLEAWIHSCGAP